MKTHTWILIVLACLCGSISGIARGQTVTPPDQVLKKEYVSPDRRFKVRFPDEPKEIDFPLDTKTGKLVFHTLMHPGTVTYTLGYTDYPINFEKENAVKTTLDRGRDGSLARVAKEDPRILSDSDISVDGYPGRFFRVELKGDAIIRNEIVLAANRQYVLAVGTPKGDPSNLEIQKAYEKLASDFFDSFKITPPLEADLTANWKEFSSTEGRYRIQFPGVPFDWSFPLDSVGVPATCYATVYVSAGQYTVMYIDFADPPEPTDRQEMKQLLDDLRDGQFDKYKAMGLKFEVLSESDISCDGYPGRFMVVDLNRVAMWRVKTIVVKNRVYLLTVLMPRDDLKAADPKAYERLSLKFIDSFKLTKEPATKQE